MRRVRVIAGALLALATAGCADDATGPEPVPTIDLGAYFVLPDSGFVKFFTGGTSQTYVQDTTVDGLPVVEILQANGQHDYLRRPDRAWVGWRPAGDTSVFLIDPPLAAIPAQMPVAGDHVAASSIPASPAPVPVRRLTRLVDTGLTVNVRAGTFDRVVLLRQEFWRIVSPVPPIVDTLRDSAYRWYAPGVDEIRREQWLGGATAADTVEFQGGTVGGTTYP